MGANSFMHALILDNTDPWCKAPGIGKTDKVPCSFSCTSRQTNAIFVILGAYCTQQLRFITVTSKKGPQYPKRPQNNAQTPLWLSRSLAKILGPPSLAITLSDLYKFIRLLKASGITPINIQCVFRCLF